VSQQVEVFATLQPVASPFTNNQYLACFHSQDSLNSIPDLVRRNILDNWNRGHAQIHWTRTILTLDNINRETTRETAETAETAE